MIFSKYSVPVGWKSSPFYFTVLQSMVDRGYTDFKLHLALHRSISEKHELFTVEIVNMGIQTDYFAQQHLRKQKYTFFLWTIISETDIHLQNELCGEVPLQESQKIFLLSGANRVT